MEETRLGAILLESGIIREEELERCLEIQSLTGGDRPLGRILVDQGVVPAQTLDRLLQLQSALRTDRSPQASVVQGEAMDRLLEIAIERNASELHLSENRSPMLRVAGDLQVLDDQPVVGPEIWGFMQQYMGPDVLETLAERWSVCREFRVAGNARGRICATRHFDGIHVAVRLHPWDVRPIAEVESDTRLPRILESSRGLVVVCGEQGAGVSETLASMLHQIARTTNDRFVLVLDDSLEFPEPESPNAIVSVRRTREHTRSYVTGLTSAMRENPDVLIVGDVSDPRAFDIALRAAESDRLVVVALPATSATDALRRIEQFYSHRDLPRIRTTLASVLRAVLAVRLLPARNRPDDDAAAQYMATEFLHVNDTVRDLVGSGSLNRVDLLLQMAAMPDDVGHSIDSAIMTLLDSGVVSFEDAFAHVMDKARLMESFQGRPAQTPTAAAVANGTPDGDADEDTEA